MAAIVKMESGSAGYARLVEFVRETGVPRAPHNKKTLDAGLVIVIIEDPLRAYPVGVGRGLSRRVAAAEAIQLIGAFSMPELLPPQFDRFREADGTFHGAYGDRVGRQLYDVVRKLKQDPHTRQAVITLWDPARDSVPFKNDYPCTLSLTFSLSALGAVELDVVMRSNDVWLGAPYDWFQFTQLQLTVATLLNRPVGEYRHTALSLHLYEDDVVKTHALTEDPEDIDETPIPQGLGRVGDLAHDTITRVRQLAHACTTVENLTDSERWYRNALAGLRRGGADGYRPSYVG